MFIKKIHYFLEHLLVFLQMVLTDAWFNHQDMQLLTDPFLNFPRFCNGSQVTHCHGHSSQKFTVIIAHPVVGGRQHQIEEGTSLP
jgi:hypothetical protein